MFVEMFVEIIYHQFVVKNVVEECCERVRWSVCWRYDEDVFQFVCWRCDEEMLKYVVEVDKEFVIMLWKYVMNNLH